MFFVTFKFDTANFIKLEVPFEEYSKICEGDLGTLTYKGGVYIKFEHKIDVNNNKLNDIQQNIPSSDYPFDV